MSKKALPAISLFSGAMGLDLGLEKAGFQIRVAVECNRFAAETIRKNRPDLPLIEKKIEDVTTEEILDTARLRAEEVVLVSGGPSCQSFSTAGQRGSITDPRGGLFLEFLRVVNDTQPRFFVMENVRGILSAAIRHRPLSQRGPGFPLLETDEELGSAFMLIIEKLKETGYYTIFDVLNAADFGVPQSRERVLFIGTRDSEPILMPKRTHMKEPINGEEKWVTLKKALSGLRERNPEYCELTENRKKYLQMIPAGGNWRDLPEDLWPDALGGAHNSWGGRSGFLRRLAWNRPSPALTTMPNSKATMLCHPDKLRPLSVKEYSRIQQFPDDWEFCGGTAQKYTQIGNAVPIGLGAAVGHSIINAMKSANKASKKSVVACYNEGLIDRLSKRPDTILNPPRMRKIKKIEAAQEWINNCSGCRSKILTLIETNAPRDEKKRSVRKRGKN